jgi:hypothetical protein
LEILNLTSPPVLLLPLYVADAATEEVPHSTARRESGESTRLIDFRAGRGSARARDVERRGKRKTRERESRMVVVAVEEREERREKRMKREKEEKEAKRSGTSFSPNSGRGRGARAASERHSVGTRE